MEALGINFKLIIAQIINFSLLLIILNYLLYKPVVKMLSERKEKIRKGLEDADAAKKSLEKAHQAVQTIKEQSKEEINQIFKEGKDQANLEAAQIQQKAQLTATEIIKNAEAEAKRLKEQSLKEAQNEIASLVTLAVDKIINSDLSEEEKKKLVQKSIQNI